MSLIKDINELHFTIKSIIIPVAVITPFWYAVLVIFKPEFISSQPIHIPIVIATCMTISELLCLSIPLGLYMIDDLKSKSGVTTLSVIVTSGIIVVMSIAIYFGRVKWNWPIHDVIENHLYLLVGVVISVVYSLIKEAIQKRKKKTDVNTTS